MNTTEKTAAVALCRAVREHYLPAKYWFQIPPTIEAALTALERAINAAELRQTLATEDAPAPYRADAAKAAKVPDDEPHTILGQGDTARHLSI